jgi:RNA polymerase sigma factor (sigma-70 family)
MLAAVPSLRAFAISLSGNVDRADDLVQETLVRAIANINSFHPGTNMSAWLITILRNLFRSEYRKRRREVEDAAGSYVDSLKSPAAAELGGIRGIPLGARETAVRLARGSASRRCVGLLLRGGGCDLRACGEDDQEPGQVCPHAALEAALPSTAPTGSARITRRVPFYPPTSPCLRRGKGRPCEKKKGSLCEEEK